MRRGSVRWPVLCAGVLLGVPGSWIGYSVLEYWRDKRLLDEITAAEPSLGYDGASWGAPDLDRLRVTQDCFLARPSVWRVVYPVFSRVDSVFFRDIADADLERSRAVVERFSRPVELCLNTDKITDSGLEKIARFKNLNGLALYSSDAQLTDAGVARLRALPNLETLSLDCRALTEQSVLEITRFPKLRQIALSQVPVTVKALEALGRMKTLKSLDLRSAALSEDASEMLDVFKEAHPDLDVID